MIKNNDISELLQQQVLTAIEKKTPLKIQGGGSKDFYGNKLEIDTVLDVSPHTGIVAHEATELTVTVKAGTNLQQLEQYLAQQQQQLPFEPPQFSKTSTIGGVVIAGLAGPRRPWSGTIRDNILGVRIISGQGKIVEFGGQVMKNVAGYDVSRLMVSSLGTLGVLLEVSLKLMPKPAGEMTLSCEMKQSDALHLFQQWQQKNLPVSATCYYEDCLYVRLSGHPEVLKHTVTKIEGEIIADGYQFWEKIRNQRHEFFCRTDKPLWRISLAPATPAVNKLGDQMMIEWNGSQRWIYSNIPANIIRSLAKKYRGHAILFKGDKPGVNHFPPLAPNLFALHQKLKNALDPHHIFNPDRIYKDL